MIRQEARIVLTTIVFAGVAYAQSARAQPAFEVASVKPSLLDSTGKRAPTLVRGGPGSSDPTLATFENIDLFSLVTMAYGIQRYQLVGPDWLGDTRFDITARVPPGATRDQYRLMLQRLLSERFRLTLHHDSKQIQLVEMVVAKNGPKLKEVPVDPAAAADPGLQPPLPRAGPPPGYHGPFNLALPKASMERLAALLSGLLDQPVVDATGLTGTYEIKLRALVGSNPPATDAADSPPILVEAVQEQLGLKLTPSKGLVEVLVIDHIEKTPTLN
jgi:uncharacterized protein (TIGR03435 family)